MDENPYQSPVATDDALEASDVPGTPKPPPSRWEMTLFGAMVGVLYHSAAGFVLGLAFGIQVTWLAGGQELGVYFATAFEYSIAFSIVAVMTGATTGAFLVLLHWTLPDMKLFRWTNWLLSRGLHLLLGFLVGTAFFTETVDALHGESNVSDPTMFAVGTFCMVCCLTLGWIVARMIDIRLQRSLERISSDAK